MKTSRFLPALLIAAIAFFTVSCDKNDTTDNGDSPFETFALLDVADDGATRVLVNNICPVLPATNPLTADEIEFLYAVREDEKLSADLYSLFAANYPDQKQFSKIAAAEATHIAAIEKIFNFYEIDFPALGEPGVFTDPDRQSYYNELVVQASSALAAFTVMASIEEENIVVYSSVAGNMENPNIQMILTNFVKGSSNHLKAAVRQIIALGGNYTPLVIEQDEFDKIINSSFSQGRKYGRQNGVNGQNNSTNSGKKGEGQGNKGSVSNTGICTGTCNGSSPGSNTGGGKPGKGYRGGRK